MIRGVDGRTSHLLRPEHAQQVQALSGDRARRRGVDDQPLIVLGGEQDLAVQFEPVDHGRGIAVPVKQILHPRPY